jgi:predicted dehydrogenase
MSERSTVRVGIIGAGAVSQVVHLPILTERPDVDVVAIADADLHKAEALARRFGVPAVMDSDALLQFDEVDALVLCTPNNLHEEMAVTALESGLDLLVERPLAASSAGAARVLEAAEQSGRTLAVGVPHRFRPEVTALRSFVEGGALGDLFAARASWLTRHLPGARTSWRSDRESAGGGALIDLGISAVDLCLWSIGFPDITTVSCALTGDGEAVEHSGSLLLQTAQGMAISIEVSNRLFASEDRYYLRVMGSEGSASIPPLEVFKLLGGRPMEVTPRQPKPRGGENPYTNAYRRLLDDWVRTLAGLAERQLPREQVVVMKIIEAAYRSAEFGSEVDVDSSY